MLQLLDMITSRMLFLALHLNNASSFPAPLGPVEETRCLEAFAAGDLAARDCLVEHNLRLVVHVIKNSYNKGYREFHAPFLDEYPAWPAAGRRCCG